MIASSRNVMPAYFLHFICFTSEVTAFAKNFKTAQIVIHAKRIIVVYGYKAVIASLFFFKLLALRRNLLVT